MIYIKTESDIRKMHEGGKISKNILDRALDMCVEGITTKEIDAEVEFLMKNYSVIPWFKEIDNYPCATCISVNEVWLHGIPSDAKLKKGDVVSIDLGVKYNGYYIDNCWTTVVSVGNRIGGSRLNFAHSDKSVTDFLEIGVLSLDEAIKKFHIGNRVGDISNAMQKIIEGKGFSVIRDFTGHGVGIKAHEAPAVPCYGTAGAGSLLKLGMVFAIEVMYSMGSPENEVGSDGWSVVTKDRQLTAMFEHTVALTENGPETLTR